jgi:DNA-binding transcriptional LysR family regulator
MRLHGIEPSIQVVTHSFLTVPALVSGTARVALLQRRLADRVPADAGIRVLPCPIDLPPMVEVLWWHPMYDDDPEHGFLRELIRRAAGELA